MKISFKDLKIGHYAIPMLFNLPNVKVYYYSLFSDTFTPINKAETVIIGTSHYCTHIVFGQGTECDMTTALWHTKFYDEKFFIETDEFDKKVLDELILQDSLLAAKIITTKEKGKNTVSSTESDKFLIKNVPIQEETKKEIKTQTTKKFTENSKTEEMCMSNIATEKGRPTVFSSLTKVA